MFLLVIWWLRVSVRTPQVREMVLTKNHSILSSLTVLHAGEPSTHTRGASTLAEFSQKIHEIEIERSVEGSLGRLPGSTITCKRTSVIYL